MKDFNHSASRTCRFVDSFNRNNQYVNFSRYFCKMGYFPFSKAPRQAPRPPITFNGCRDTFRFDANQPKPEDDNCSQSTTKVRSE